jgi:hypothetical protein
MRRVHRLIRSEEYSWRISFKPEAERFVTCKKLFWINDFFCGAFISPDSYRYKYYAPLGLDP